MSVTEFVFPQKVIQEKQMSNYGKFIIAPFEPGYGYTVGNTLRRVLLSSFEGAAITACRICGYDNQWVRHEFDILEHIKEDAMLIILNLRKIRLKMYTQGPEILTLHAKGEKTVTAGDIKQNPNIEILNPDQVIATLEMKAVLKMELEVNRGRGYVVAEENRKPYHSVDTIPIDALFSPIIKVNYEIESSRVGQRIDYDRLILEIWTDSSILPADALAYSAKVFRDTLDVFITGEKKEEKVVSTIEVIQEEKLKELLGQPIEILGLSSRPINCLKGTQIKTLRELVAKKEEEIMNLRNMGKKSVEEIKNKLAEYKLFFGMTVE